jgi:hypothetical protein
MLGYMAVDLLGFAFLAGIMAAGCTVVEKRVNALATPAPTCHPSQYWDGHQCRHKGQGYGARKHDGAPPGRGPR